MIWSWRMVFDHFPLYMLWHMISWDEIVDIPLHQHRIKIFFKFLWGMSEVDSLYIWPKYLDLNFSMQKHSHIIPPISRYITNIDYNCLDNPVFLIHTQRPLQLQGLPQVQLRNSFFQTMAGPVAALPEEEERSSASGVKGRFQSLSSPSNLIEP